MKRRNALAQKRAVFNLTVEDTHCYYANGILVHNCDALSWVTRLTLSRAAPTPVVRNDKIKSWKDRLKTGTLDDSFMSA